MHTPVIAWYKQFWPWFLIALPGSVILASIVTIYLAARAPDPLVVDDYYKSGLAINRVIDQQQTAAQLQITAVATYLASQQQIQIRLQGQLARAPQRVRLQLIHPTLQAQDRVVILTQQTADTYQATFAMPSIHNQASKSLVWHAILDAEDNQWRLDAQVDSHNTTWHFKPEV